MSLRTVVLAKIIEKRALAPQTHMLKLAAPRVARHAQPGQFVIVRVSEGGERVPFTIADADPSAGTITLVIQEIGDTTKAIGAMSAGDSLQDLLGPLGAPSEVETFGTVVLLGGGFGIAAIHMLTRALRDAGNRIISIIGARTRDLLIMENEMRAASDELIVTTDDGSAGEKGLVTQALERVISREPVHRVVAVGPIPMMRAVAEVTRPHGIKTIVSLNPVMVDGTGMCGGCRVEVGGETKFACVDGPEFDAHIVNFDELVSRNRMYTEFERGLRTDCKINRLTAAG
ncbi:MAG: sulfide/dihydroorotate dehydrogenase-like FAD/NAD-binding protein [Candidatus Sumerlaeaceae bacterium]|nr:sulfide/dihydroorotate dehydrogenase-like FAD/NAD-binding protein [Candidatus Sumerlaeaceae bacterium]